MISNQKIAKNRKNNYCEHCDYSTSNIFDFNKHMSTQKHQKLSGLAKIEPNRTEKSQKSQIFSCEYCKKNYASKSGVWSHKNKCKNKPLENTLVTTNAVSSDKDIIFELLKQNNEFKQLIVEQSKLLMEYSKEIKTLATNNNEKEPNDREH